MTQLFSAAVAPTVLIGRTNEMERVRKAICEPGTELRVVYLVGSGGLGKTRMLQEVKRAAGRATWCDGAPPVLVSDVLDLEPVRLSTTLRFVSDLVNALDPNRIHFSRFREQHLRHRQALVFQSSYEQIQSILHDALRSFARDYLELSEKQRIVLLLDTGEKFVIPIPPDFDREAAKILDAFTVREGHPVDTPIYTSDWLHNLLTMQNEPGWLKNTTVIMAGRPQENWWDIFDKLSKDRVQEVPIAPLTPHEIAAYFRQLTEDLQNAKGDSPSAQDAYAIRTLRQYAKLDGANLLWAYTDGQPVRLALVANLVIDGRQVPPELDQSWEDVKQKFHLPAAAAEKTPSKERVAAMRSLGGQFVELLFNSSSNLRSQILARLVRAHHPLDAAALEYLIDSRPGEHYSAWLEHRPKDDHSRLQEIAGQLNDLAQLAFFKHRTVSYGIDGPPRLQVFLQDVVYEIVDDYFSSIDELSRRREIQQRVDLYNKLIEIINSRIEECEAGLRLTWLEERRALEAELRTQSLYAAQGVQALRANFPDPSVVPLNRRNQLSRTDLRDRLEELLLERLYYLLRIDPKTAINDEYGELADSAWLEHDEDFMTQIEVQIWRLLKDENAHKLVNIALSSSVPPGAPHVGQPSRYDPWLRLQRVALQDHALRWLKRMHLRGRYDEVSVMAKAIRRYAAKVPKDPDLDQWVAPSSDYHSWNHTLTQEEINVYEAYAYAYTGRTNLAVRTLNQSVKRLQAVFSPGNAKKHEEPFDLRSDAMHKGANRVRRVIGIAQFVLGYAYAANGEFAASHKAYSAALPHLRRTRFRSLEVYCRFNMARALAELGYTVEAAKNCEDALNMLTLDGKGGTLPFAYASNTLALVYNAERTLDAAWPQAAVAHACFLRMSEARGVALAEMQFGETLRRLADRHDRQQYSPDRETPRHIYEESERVLWSAYNSFLLHPILSREGQRRAEAAIELASSLRDQVRVLNVPTEKDKHDARRILLEADRLLHEAEDVARQIEHRLLQLDARWAQATLLYRASRTGLGTYSEREGQPISSDELVRAFTDVAQAALELKVVSPKAWISHDNPNPHIGRSQVRAVRRLGRIYGRLGRIYAEEFIDLSEAVRKREGLLPYVSIDEAERSQVLDCVLADPATRGALQKMAENYVIALGYAHMFNPSAHLNEYLFGDLYDRVKAYNRVTMKAFTEFLLKSESDFHVQQLQRTRQVGVLDALARSFGSY